MINYTIIKHKNINLSVIDVSIYKNFSLTSLNTNQIDENIDLSSNKIEYMDAEIVFFEPQTASNINNPNCEILFDYEFRSKEVDDKLLKLRGELLERTNSSKKGFFKFFKSKLFK